MKSKLRSIGGAVPLHQLRLQRERLHALAGQRDAGDRAREDLQVDALAHHLAHAVHRGERVLAGVEERRLVARAAAELEVADAGRHRRLERGDDVLGADLAAEDALQPVAEGGEHDADLFAVLGVDHR
jgi:hypothetical protein